MYIVHACFFLPKTDLPIDLYLNILNRFEELNLKLNEIKKFLIKKEVFNQIIQMISSLSPKIKLRVK